MGNEVRTRDLSLGKVGHYQLSYSFLLGSIALFLHAVFQSPIHCGRNHAFFGPASSQSSGVNLIRM